MLELYRPRRRSIALMCIRVVIMLCHGLRRWPSNKTAELEWLREIS